MKNNKITEKELTLPPGTQHGTEFRIKNRGATYLRGKGKGDQYVVVAVNIPKDITNEQKELLLMSHFLHMRKYKMIYQD